MINANELRLGNIIDIAANPNGPDERWERRPVDAFLIRLIADPQAQVKTRPVPLSPEILEAAGFKEHKDGGVILIDEVNVISLIYINEVFLLRQGKDYIELNGEHKHLHQLQNLYFALTGQELTVNLPVQEK